MKLCLQCNQYFDEPVEKCPSDGALLENVGKDPLIGALINNRYLVDSVIGKGSSGIVYKARRLGRGEVVVAIKVLHSYIGAVGSSLDRFLREAQAASKLRNPHIITIWDTGVTEDGQPYFVMDYLEGTTLGHVIRDKGNLEPERVISLLHQICEALVEAHRQGIVHRDLKPENIVLQESPHGHDYVKLLDFGIADSPQHAQSSFKLEKPRTVSGSPAYMSPEQCQGLELDDKSDIYSLTIVVFEMLTGCRPFPQLENVNVMVLHVNEPPMTLSAVRPDLHFPDAVEDVIARALSKQPFERQSSVQEFLLEFEMAWQNQGNPQSALAKAVIQQRSILNETLNKARSEQLQDATTFDDLVRHEDGEVMPIWGNVSLGASKAAMMAESGMPGSATTGTPATAMPASGMSINAPVMPLPELPSSAETGTPEMAMPASGTSANALSAPANAVPEISASNVFESASNLPTIQSVPAAPASPQSERTNDLNFGLEDLQSTANNGFAHSDRPQSFTPSPATIDNSQLSPALAKNIAADNTSLEAEVFKQQSAKREAELAKQLTARKASSDKIPALESQVRPNEAAINSANKVQMKVEQVKAEQPQAQQLQAPQLQAQQLQAEQLPRSQDMVEPDRTIDQTKREDKAQQRAKANSQNWPASRAVPAKSLKESVSDQSVSRSKTVDRLMEAAKRGQTHQRISQRIEPDLGHDKPPVAPVPEPAVDKNKTPSLQGYNSNSKMPNPEKTEVPSTASGWFPLQEGKGGMPHPQTSSILFTNVSNNNAPALKQGSPSNYNASAVDDLLAKFSGQTPPGSSSAPGSSDATGPMPTMDSANSYALTDKRLAGRSEPHLPPQDLVGDKNLLRQKSQELLSSARNGLESEEEYFIKQKYRNSIARIEGYKKARKADNSLLSTRARAAALKADTARPPLNLWIFAISIIITASILACAYIVYSALVAPVPAVTSIEVLLTSGKYGQVIDILEGKKLSETLTDQERDELSQAYLRVAEQNINQNKPEQALAFVSKIDPKSSSGEQISALKNHIAQMKKTQASDSSASKIVNGKKPRSQTRPK